jgi:hypothetical protein
MDDELCVEPLGGLVAEADHFLELPARVDVQQRERDASREERLAGKVQQDRRVLADRVHQQGLRELRGHLAHDVDAFGLEPRQVGHPAQTRAAAHRLGFQSRYGLNLGLNLGVHVELSAKSAGTL